MFQYLKLDILGPVHLKFFFMSKSCRHRGMDMSLSSVEPSETRALARTHTCTYTGLLFGKKVGPRRSDQKTPTRFCCKCPRKRAHVERAMSKTRVPHDDLSMNPNSQMFLHEYVSIRQHISAYFSIRQHTSAHVSIRD